MTLMTVEERRKFDAAPDDEGILSIDWSRCGLARLVWPELVVPEGLRLRPATRPVPGSKLMHAAPPAAPL